MKEFFYSNWVTILILAVILVDIVYLVVTRKWSILREQAYMLMLAVEKAIASSAEGRDKFEIVFARVYCLLPAWFRLFVPPDTLRRKLQEWYTLMLDELDDGVINGSSGSQPPGPPALV